MNQTSSLDVTNFRCSGITRAEKATCVLNEAFVSLRSLIPTEPQNRKLSKIEILQLATGYVEHLNAIVLTGAHDANFA